MGVSLHTTTITTTTITTTTITTATATAAAAAAATATATATTATSDAVPPAQRALFSPPLAALLRRGLLPPALTHVATIVGTSSTTSGGRCLRSLPRR